ncbi:2-C-methyl-D-erythritol 4-phosphate cytidylyltransferase [bacterium]|nr:2-C-methyl-D-erythritol 4-phosphate cytidylyltransferase [bacterium]
MKTVTKHRKTGAVIVAAGKGQRLKQNTPKCFLKINGIPLFIIALQAFERAQEIDEIVLVVPEGFEKSAYEHITTYKVRKCSEIVAGGFKRQDSALNGIKVLNSDIENILIHDGARCLISEDLIARIVKALATESVILPANQITDTLHRRSGDFAFPGPTREDFVTAQTPQGFHRRILEEAFEKNKNDSLQFTDEVSMVRGLLDVKAFIVRGERDNVKITHPEDLNMFKHQLESKSDIISKVLK